VNSTNQTCSMPGCKYLCNLDKQIEYGLVSRYQNYGEIAFATTMAFVMMYFIVILLLSATSLAYTDDIT